jgi:hypothetical protein
MNASQSQNYRYTLREEIRRAVRVYCFWDYTYKFNRTSVPRLQKFLKESKKNPKLNKN